MNITITTTQKIPVKGPRSINPDSAGGYGNVYRLRTNNPIPEIKP